MTKNGVLYVCDRCGEQKFVANGEVVTASRVPAGWGKTETKYLCPTCAELYNNFLNTFFAPEVKRPINLEG